DFSEKKEGFWSKYSFELRIAAGIAVFLTVAIMYFTSSFGFLKNMVSNQLSAAELPLEIREVLQYYNVVVDEKVDQLAEVTPQDEEGDKIRKLAAQELEELDVYSEELKKELALNPGNERVKAALIVNQKKKSQILDKIINSVSNENN
ncbi:MAG: hypothetical protein K8R53_14630, partial [Bacteroidales bacterium]|nr:hypothetical protein [Bacteroidales bacterium]